jgi:hypothetical protein
VTYVTVTMTHKLQQLRKSAFAIKNSSTLILPKWFVVLKDLELDPKTMPRDVRTRWNSTFDMLDFAVEYREALDAIMGDHETQAIRAERGGLGDCTSAAGCSKGKCNGDSSVVTLTNSYRRRYSKMPLFSFHEARRTSPW